MAAWRGRNVLDEVQVELELRPDEERRCIAKCPEARASWQDRTTRSLRLAKKSPGVSGPQVDHPGLLKHGVPRYEGLFPDLPKGWGDRVRGDMISAAEKVTWKLGGPDGRRTWRRGMGGSGGGDRSSGARRVPAPVWERSACSRPRRPALFPRRERSGCSAPRDPRVAQRVPLFVYSPVQSSPLL